MWGGPVTPLTVAPRLSAMAAPSIPVSATGARLGASGLTVMASVALAVVLRLAWGRCVVGGSGDVGGARDAVDGGAAVERDGGALDPGLGDRGKARSQRVDRDGLGGAGGGAEISLGALRGGRERRCGGGP